MIHGSNGEYKAFLARKRIETRFKGIDPREPHQILFPFQRDIVKWALRRGRACVFADCGMGKGQPKTAKILTPHGWRMIGALATGDAVIASDGKPYLVTGIYPKPRQATFRVCFSDDTSITVDDEHLHIIRTNNDRQRGCPWRVVSTQYLRKAHLRYGLTDKSRNFDIPVMRPAELGGQIDPLISPYVLGVILGDGCAKGNVSISSADNEVIERCKRELPTGVALGKVKSSKYDWKIKTGNTGRRRHPFREALNQLGILGKLAHEKEVPQCYLFAASPMDRLALLQGLMDTDGYISSSGCSEFYSVSESLARGLMFLVQSLGGMPKIKTKKATLNGVRHRDCFRVVFSLKGLCPFHLSRKAKKWNPAPRDNGRWISGIEYLWHQETVCINVDSPDNSYVTEGCVVTHNTFMQIEWARQIPGNVLILAPLAVANQTILEAAKLDCIVKYCRHQSEVEKGITIANYEMLEHFKPHKFKGIVLDESSIIKHFEGKFRNAIITGFAKTPFRLACTATPAPNDHMELGNHAEFVGAMSRTEMLSMFFVHDGGETSKWRLKGHAEKEFWKWVCSWAVMIRKPSDLGYEDGGFILPPLKIEQITVEHENIGENLFAMEAQTLSERITARRESVTDRVKKCAELVNGSREAWVIWCNLNSESDQLQKAINGSVNVQGSDKIDDKLRKLNDFSAYKTRIMISKPKIAGHGLNWQHCSNVAFVGLSDSWEQYYQSVRRCWRFGQTREVRVYIITSTAEGQVVLNIKRKEAEAIRMASEMVKHMHSINEANIKGVEKTEDAYVEDVAHGENFTIHLGDCVEKCKKIENDSIGYSIFSPPFASLYTYSASERDLGNVKSDAEFYEHFNFVIFELFRVLMPGRLVSFHCMDVPSMKSRDGMIGLKDFPAILIKAFQDAGFIYHSRVVIWKDPLVEATRTKSLGLMHKQILKDSAMCRQGLPDYLITMRKPGNNPEPIQHPDGFTNFIGIDEPQAPRKKPTVRSKDIEAYAAVTSDDPVYSHQVWRRYASPVWMDINPSRTLQKDSMRDEKDERHICPLQLDVIERALELWSNPGDTILSPFAGIGSEGFVAVSQGRKFIGIELKASYWKQAVANLTLAEADRDHDLMTIPS